MWLCVVRADLKSCSAVTRFLLCYDSVNSAEVCKSLLLYHLQVWAKSLDCCVSEHGSPVMKSWWGGLVCLTDNTPLLWTHCCLFFPPTHLPVFPTKTYTDRMFHRLHFLSVETFGLTCTFSFSVFFPQKPTSCVFIQNGFGVNNKQRHTWL